ncbi:molybdate ABC transporter substrate-binding protein [Marinomonas flavescens]|uniref:molybdate ABC transporter substrate-binding protein n=1 Tax=Marinomonas flavescens TaxID=2529379 RepID=UPI001A9DB7AA|nr:molybdate ABC transporter substrate-binding protein [Marinomonas flavescens]
MMFFDLRKRERIPLYSFIKIATISFFMFCSGIIFAEPLRIAVASNFTSPMQKLAPLFEKETGQKIQLSFGSSGKFYAQIQHGAPFDVFLSADQAKPNKLIQMGLALKESQTVYAKGTLALWSAKLKSVEPITNVLKNARKIAIANPKLAPYGKAAEETLKKLNLWSPLKNKLVQGENIGQTYQFVYTKNADVGFVALSQVLSGDIKGSFWTVPSSFHADIKQSAVVIKKSKQKKMATAFLAFLMRPDIQKKIASFGYQTSIK